MTLESVSDGFTGNVPDLEILAFSSSQKCHQTYSDQLIFSSGSQVSTIWAEADASDVKVSLFIDCVVLKLTDFLTSVDIVYLCRSIATRRDVLAILTETDTAHDTFMQKVVEKLDVEDSG